MGEGPLNVLLIEDNPGDSRLIQILLAEAEDANFVLTTAERLSIGIDRLRGGSFDVVLLDLSLPDSSGLDTLRRLQAPMTSVPIIVLTGLDDRGLALQAVREGAQDFLVKGKLDAELVARAIRYACERHRMMLEIRSMSLIDELTGLYNRRGFVTIAGTQLTLATRNGLSRAVTFIDLDGFKRINDTGGHDAGDKALATIATILKSSFRSSDVIARWGGDEFVVLTIGIDGAAIADLHDRLRWNLDGHNSEAGDNAALAFSLGTAYRDGEMSAVLIDDLIAEADEAMYAQKRRRYASVT